jgi:hypothetical protein
VKQKTRIAMRIIGFIFARKGATVMGDLSLENEPIRWVRQKE